MGVEHNPNSRWYNFVYIRDLDSTMAFLNSKGFRETRGAIIIQRWWRRMKNSNNYN